MPSPADPILVEFGPFIVRWYGLLIVIGAFLVFVTIVILNYHKE